MLTKKESLESLLEMCCLFFNSCRRLQQVDNRIEEPNTETELPGANENPASPTLEPDHLTLLELAVK